ncbi:MAG: type II secretion system F family protein [archaeon]|jgi:pilus assembly protein TadC
MQSKSKSKKTIEIPPSFLQILSDKIQNINLENFCKFNIGIENKVSKNANFRKKEFQQHKFESLKLSVLISLFLFLFFELYLHNLFLTLGIAIFCFAIIFLLALQIPLIKKKKYAKKIENGMPNFLTNLITELKVGKNVFDAIKKCATGEVGSEYLQVLKNVEQGTSFSDALLEMNASCGSLIVKRTNSNLNNLYLHGNDVYSLKKFNDELLMRQRIESKEFSGKMVVYALVFIAVSAIVPAMFISFILIGSYFMEIQFTALQIFIIIVFVFPLIDSSVLMMINSKTPIFLRSK